MQKWRQWEAASEVEWGLALERETVIRRPRNLPLSIFYFLRVAPLDLQRDRDLPETLVLRLVLSE